MHGKERITSAAKIMVPWNSKDIIKDGKQTKVSSLVLTLNSLVVGHEFSLSRSQERQARETSPASTQIFRHAEQLIHRSDPVNTAGLGPRSRGDAKTCPNVIRQIPDTLS